MSTEKEVEMESSSSSCSSSPKAAATSSRGEEEEEQEDVGMPEEEAATSTSREGEEEEEEEDFGIPVELLQQVFSYLPFLEVIRGRIVCRSWLEALTSPTFFILWSRRSSPSLWLLPDYWSPSSPLHAFHLVSHLCLPLPCPSPSSSTLITSSHGILCFRYPYSVSLVNPLSRLFLLIPLPNSIVPFFHFGFTLHPLSLNRFYILACGLSRSQPSPHAELYDSDLRTWVPLHRPPLLEPTDEAPGNTQQFVWWNGKFCFLSSNCLVTYDVHASQWGSVNLPHFPRIRNSHYMTLHVIQGRLFLEGNYQRQGDFQRRYPLTVGILELDPTTLQWMEITLMPQEIAHKLCDDAQPVHSIYTSFSDADCDHICFSPLRTENKRQLVFYHVGENKWTYDIGWHYHFSFSNFKQWTFQPNFAALLEATALTNHKLCGRTSQLRSY